MGYHTALVMDVDGVVSPVHGANTWGDDVVAGHVFGPVIVSVGLCLQLDALSEVPGVQSLWLTDWDAEMRQSMKPFPGQHWPSIADPDEGRIRARLHAGDRWDLLPWWKWWALDAWLDDNADISTVVWCDDDLVRALAQPDLDEATEQTRVDFCVARLLERGIRPCLIAPNSDKGLSRGQVTQIERMVRH